MIVLHSGVSERKIKPRIIPKIGPELLKILVVVIENFLKLMRNSVCPSAVVRKASKSTDGHSVFKGLNDTNNRVGERKNATTPSW